MRNSTPIGPTNKRSFGNLSIVARHHWTAFGLFLLLSLLVTWPLILNLTDMVPGFYVADNYEYLWKMWWFKHSLVDLNQNPLFATHIFYPEGFALAHAELTPLHTVLGLPLTWLFGEITAYNIFSILTFLLSAWAAFALIYQATGNFYAGLVTGICFTLSPYHTVRYGGILPYAAIQGIPILFWGIELWFQKRELRWAALAALGFTLSGWAISYYAAALAILLPFYGLIRFHPLSGVLNRQGGLALLTFGSISLLTILPPLLPHLQLSDQVDLTIPLDDTDFWSASPTDYLLPNGLHPLWGEYVRQNLLSIPADQEQIALEFVLGAGFITLLFSFYGWKFSKNQFTKAVTVLTFTALILSFGPTLHFGRHPVVIPASDTIVNGFNQAMDWIGSRLPTGETYQLLHTDGLTIPLPALLIRWLIPLFSEIRAWNRFAIFAHLGFSLLAGIGVHAWMKRELAPKYLSENKAKRRALIGGTVLGLLIVFELWPGQIPLQPVEPRSVDLWLASQETTGNIMELPLASALSAPQMQYTRYHGQNIAFGYGTFFPYWYRQEFPELNECPQQECIRRLTEWKVDYLLLNTSALSTDSSLEFELKNSPFFKETGQWDDIVVFEFLP